MGPGPLAGGAWGARTVRATAAAVGPGAARRGAWGARIALGHRRRRRGARGGGNVTNDEFGKCHEKTKMRENHKRCDC